MKNDEEVVEEKYQIADKMHGNDSKILEDSPSVVSDFVWLANPANGFQYGLVNKK